MVESATEALSSTYVKQDGTPLRVVESNHGAPLIEYEGYLFRFTTRGSKISTHWHCHDRGTCKVRLHVSNGMVIKKVQEHDHPANPTKLDVYRVRNILKRKAEECDDPASDVVREVLSSIDVEVRKALPVDDHLRRQVRRVRQRLLESRESLKLKGNAMLEGLSCSHLKLKDPLKTPKDEPEDKKSFAGLRRLICSKLPPRKRRRLMPKDDDQIEHDGYKYVQQRVDGVQVYWGCVYGFVCSAKLVTVKGVVVMTIGEHNHSLVQESDLYGKYKGSEHLVHMKDGELVQDERSNLVLFHKNYTYIYSQFVQGIVHFRCRIASCGAYLTVNRGKCTRIKGDKGHNHEPNEDFQRLLIQFGKRLLCLAYETTLSPGEILAKLSHEVDDDVAEHVESVAILKRRINLKRQGMKKKLLSKP